MIKIMTPGPTQVRENVRLARACETTNPDLDASFYREYKEICDSIGALLHTTNPVYVMSGEGILGLEAACASLTEPNDRVLVIDNGVYGAGFADFVSLYGGIPIRYTCSYQDTISTEALARYLEQDHNYKYATIVHNDTPSGMTNDVHTIGRLLHQYGILSVVDSVSGMIGERLDIDEGQLDLVCGASQKAFSAPVGLTFVAVSPQAHAAMEQRRTPIASFYANLMNFKNYEKDQWFPYTMPISDIYGLRAAIANIQADPAIIERHRSIAAAVRRSITKAGLTLYANSGYSNNVTVFCVPEGIRDQDILTRMCQTHQIMLAGSFGPLAGKVIRIGHMGENANIPDVQETLAALDETLQFLNWQCKVPLAETFQQALEIEFHNSQDSRNIQ